MAVSPHLPIGSIPTSQAMSAPQRLLGETVSLLVVNPGVSVKQETEVGVLWTHSLATVSESPQRLLGVVVPTTTPSSLSPQSSPRPEFLSVFTCKARAAAAPEFAWAV